LPKEKRPHIESFPPSKKESQITFIFDFNEDSQKFHLEISWNCVELKRSVKELAEAEVTFVFPDLSDTEKMTAILGELTIL